MNKWLFLLAGSSMVECLILVQEVEGSSPSPPAYNIIAATLIVPNKY